MPCLHPNSLIKGCRYYEGPPLGQRGLSKVENETLLKNYFFSRLLAQRKLLWPHLSSTVESLSVSLVLLFVESLPCAGPP